MEVNVLYNVVIVIIILVTDDYCIKSIGLNQMND